MANWGNIKPPLGSVLDTSHPLAQGLVGCWLFNEASGLYTYDVSGNNNTGTLTNMASPATDTSGWSSNGKHGHALSFDGSNDSVSVSDSQTLRPDYVTISAWCFYKGVEGGTDINVIDKGYSGGNRSYRMYTASGLSTGKMSFGIYGTATQVATDTSLMPLGQWVHYVGVYNGSNIVLYRDANIVATTVAAFGAIQYAATPVTIGSGAFYKFNGLIDNVSIYNRALSADEIKSLYEQPFQMIRKPSTSRVFYSLPPTPVSDTLEIIHNTREAIPATSQIIYNVRQSVPDSLQLIHNVRQAVSDSVQVLHNVNATVSDSLEVLFNTREAVSDSIQAIYNVRGTSSDTIQLIANTRAKIADTLQLVYDVNAKIADTLQIIYNVLSASSAGNDITLRFNTRAKVDNALELVHNVRANATDTLEILHNVRAKVADTLAIIYHVRVAGVTVDYGDLTLIATHGVFGDASSRIIALATHGIFSEFIVIDLSLEWYIRVTTQGRHGVVVFRYMTVTTNGRYDRILSDEPIVITVYEPYLQFAQKLPEVTLEVNTPNIMLSSR